MDILWFTTTRIGEVVLTMLVSMLPVIELRGGIPFGVSLGLSPWTAFIASVIGNLIPIPFIILFIRQIFRWVEMRNSKLARMVIRLEKRAAEKSKMIKKYRLFGLGIFVAIPLPGTGGWTGALIAAIMNIRLRDALPAISLGILIAGFLITGLTYGFSVLLGTVM